MACATTPTSQNTLGWHQMIIDDETTAEQKIFNSVANNHMHVNGVTREEAEKHADFVIRRTLQLEIERINEENSR